MGLSLGVGVFSAEKSTFGVGLGVGFGGGSWEWISGSDFKVVSCILILLSFFYRPLGCIPKETADAI